MNFLMINSLRIKIILNMSVIIILFLGVFQSYKYYQLKDQMESDLKNRSDRIIERLVNELEAPLWDLDEDLIKILIDSEAKVDYVHAIYVKGDNDVNIKVDKDNSGPEHAIDTHTTRSQDILHNGNKIGEVKLFVTFEFINNRLSDELKSAIVLAALEIIIIILLLWIMLNKTILTPIGSLVKSTKLIADGHYSNVKLDISNNEIGLLGQSIQKMNDNIASREHDIKQSAEQLKEVKEQLELAVNGTRDGLWDWDIEKNEVYFSVPWKKMIGYEDNEFVNAFESWEKILHPDDAEKVKAAIAASHSSKDGSYDVINRLQHKDGSWVWILARGKTIFNEEGKAVRMVGFHTDITQQKNLELELQEQEELIIAQSRHVAMGEMISMIAHQWRQPITVIAMSANNMLVDIALEQVSNESFENGASAIVEQTQYLSKTIDDFKNFFRPNKEKDEINVCDVVNESIGLMGKNIQNSNIELIFTDSIDETVTTFSRELLQVIINFLKNAKDVLEEKSTKNAYIKVSVESLEDSFVYSVCDNGGGVDESIKSRIFDPYFSTKGPSVGTGLGLYMSKIIVEKHLNGEIQIVDTDDGVCFKVVLPKDIKDKA